MDTGNQFLGTERIGKLMRQYAVPCIISLLVGALYNIVDQIFIANASYLGSYGNAANTVVFPLTVVALGIAVFIGDGCCAFVSIALGRNAREDAHKSVGNAVVLCVVSSLVLTAVYLIFSEPILALFGGTVNEETHVFAKEYFFYITLGIPFYMFGQAMNPVIRSDGSPKFAMIATVSGAIANVILDPIFIYGFRWGMMGAAVATVIGQVLTAALSIWYLRHMKVITLEKGSFRLDGKLIPKFLVLGLTSFLAQISLVISMAAVQNMCMKYGAKDPIFGQPEYAQIPLAVLGIVMKFFQIAISIAIGMAAGCIPIAGYNIGAKKRDRAKALFSKLLLAEFIVGAVALVIVEVFPLQIAMLFGAANESAYYTLAFGKNLVIDPHTRQVILGGRELKLTPKEFDLLFCLASNPGRVFSREQLYAQIWDEYSAYNVDEVVKAQIKSLRRKLSDVGKEYIKNVWGIGYRFLDEDDK